MTDNRPRSLLLFKAFVVATGFGLALVLLRHLVGVLVGVLQARFPDGPVLLVWGIPSLLVTLGFLAFLFLNFTAVRRCLEPRPDRTAGCEPQGLHGLSITPAAAEATLAGLPPEDLGPILDRLGKMAVRT